MKNVHSLGFLRRLDWRRVASVWTTPMLLAATLLAAGCTTLAEVRTHH